MPRRPGQVVVVTWLLAGFGAVVGSILGNAAGRVGLFTGAIVGGVLTTTGAVMLVARLGWLSRSERLPALAGGLVGFGIAAPIAVANLHTPVTPILATSLAGVGALVGALVSAHTSSR